MVMGHITLDELVRGLIISQDKTVHYYWPYLKLSVDCLRELRIDTIGVIKPVKYVMSVDTEAFTIEAPFGAFNVVEARINGKENCCYHRNGNKITFQGLRADDVIEIEFVTDSRGACCSASKVPVIAQAAIEAYVLWKRSQGRQNKDSAEGRLYYNEMRILRGRASDLKITDTIPGRIR